MTKSKHASKNLTLNDWLVVIAFCDANPNMTQEEIVEHFAKLLIGALKFTQSTLSCHLSKEGQEPDSRANSCRMQMLLWHIEHEHKLLYGQMLNDALSSGAHIWRKGVSLSMD